MYGHPTLNSDVTTDYPVIYDDPAKRMIYNIHQMCMDILWYVGLDVSSNDPVD